jgi:serine protease DegQ
MLYRQGASWNGKLRRRKRARRWWLQSRAAIDARGKLKTLVFKGFRSDGRALRTSLRAAAAILRARLPIRHRQRGLRGTAQLPLCQPVSFMACLSSAGDTSAALPQLSAALASTLECARLHLPARTPIPMRPIPTLLTLALAAAFGGFVASGINAHLDNRAEAAPAPITIPATSALPAAVAGQPVPSLAPMLEKVTPAVVSVNTKQVVRVRNPFFEDPFFRRLFPDVPQERINESLGSGVIIDAAEGLVLTNHHVIDNADDVQVTLSDGRTVKAEFLGSDADTDIALIRIPAQGLTGITLGNSDQLRVGDFVVAIGNPFGFTQTVTSGIVSAVGRSGIRGLGYQNFIQTDASINPGNSGGALVNLQGQLVGINTASFNPQGSMAGNIGLGLAIPSNLARNVVDQLVKHGVVVRGTLGIESQNLTPQLAQGLGLSEARGALVSRVLAGSAAAAAGVRAGDVVVTANGQRVDSAQALHNIEGLAAVGSAMTLELRRDGKPVQVKAMLKEQARAISGDTLDPRLGGATFVDLPESLRQSGLSGVLVNEVTRGSRAAASGLAKGDIVTEASAGEFADLASWRANFQQPPQQLVLRIVRGNARGQLVMR